MPTLKEYHILISHSWEYSYHYGKVKEWLNETKCFFWKDYSVPITKPLDVKSKKELQERLSNRIALCNGIIILSGMYATYSEWIDFEIDTSIAFGKPIIGVKPWGQERIPLKIQNNADIMVGWNATSIVNAVRDYAL